MRLGVDDSPVDAKTFDDDSRRHREASIDCYSNWFAIRRAHPWDDENTVDKSKAHSDGMPNVQLEQTQNRRYQLMTRESVGKTDTATHVREKRASGIIMR